jgi:hypothetical protein
MNRLVLIALLSAAVCSAQVVVKNHATGALIGTQLVLPDAPVGDTEQFAFDVVNTGTANVTVNSAIATGEYYTLCCESAFHLAPSQTVTLTLAFAPLAAGYSSGSIQIDALTIFTFARGDAAASLFVQSAAGSTQAHVDTPTVLTFPASYNGQLSCILVNNGSGPVTVGNIAVLGDFTLVAAPSLPLVLQPGQQVTFALAGIYGAATTAISGVVQIDSWSYAITAHVAEPNMTIQLPSSLLSSGQQSKISVAFDSPPLEAASGTVTLTFTPSTTIAIEDPAIVFPSTGSTTVNFASVPGQTSASFSGQTSVVLQTGTTAGTIHLHAAWDYTTADADVNLEAAAVGVDSVIATKTSRALTVVINGFDNTRTAGRMTFNFYDSQGEFVGQPVPADFTEAFYNYFFGAATNYGGMFQVTASIPVLTGNTNQISGVAVDLQNSAGNTETKVIRFQ